MARAIDSEAAYRFLSEQLVKETGAFSEGVNKGLNIARSAMRNPDAIPTLTPPNEPLTLDELREIVGCWVWVIVTYQHEGKTFQCDGWALVETPARIAYLDQELRLAELGTRFRAYKHQASDFRVRVVPNDL